MLSSRRYPYIRSGELREVAPSNRSLTCTISEACLHVGQRCGKSGELLRSRLQNHAELYQLAEAQRVSQNICQPDLKLSWSLAQNWAVLSSSHYLFLLKTD